MYYFQVMQLEGVVGVQETHFWTLCSNFYSGGLKLEVSKDADAKYIVSHTQMIFRGIGVNQLFVQLDYEYNMGTYQNLQNFYQWFTNFHHTFVTSIMPGTLQAGHNSYTITLLFG